MQKKQRTARHPLHHIHASMKQRCFNKNVACFKHYGGAGISMCKQYLDFKSFVFLVESEIGPRPSKKHSIDRVDNKGNYEPGNIRWATQGQQLRNQKRNRLITHNGITKCASEWAEDMGTSINTILNRIDKLNWPVEKALTERIRVDRFAQRARKLLASNSK